MVVTGVGAEVTFSCWPLSLRYEVRIQTGLSADLCENTSRTKRKILTLYIHGRNPKLVDPFHVCTLHIDLNLQVFLGSVRPPAFIHNIGCGQE